MHTQGGPRGHIERPGRGEELRIDLSFQDIRNKLATRWAKLDANDLSALESEYEAFVAGNYQLLVGRLREHYGLSQSHAEEQVRQFVANLDAHLEVPEHSTPTIGVGRARGSRA